MTPTVIDDQLRSVEFTLKAAKRSSDTVKGYLGAARMFWRWYEDNHGLDDPLALAGVKRQHVIRWLAELQSKYAEASVLHFYKGLKCFFRILEQEGELQSPFVKVPCPQVGETQKDVVALEDLAGVLRYLESKAEWRNAAIVSLFADTGMRASELARIRVMDIDWSELTITLPRTKNHEVRVVPFGPSTAKRMDRWMRVRKDKRPTHMFTSTRRGFEGKPLTRSGLYQLIKEVFSRAGVSDTIGPHDLRHTFATLFMEDESARTEDLMTIGGWKSERVAGRYTKQRKVQRAIAAHRRLSPVERI